MNFLPPSRDFRRFWAARVTSFGGDQIAHVALVVLAAAQGPAAVSLVLLALSLPRLAGPLAGALADTYDAKKIMVLTDAGQAFTFLLIAVVPFHLAVHVPLVAVATALNTMFLPAGRSSIPRMVASEDLPRAFAAMAICFNVGYAAGPLVGGALLAVVEPRAALGLNVVTFVVSILFIVRLKLPGANRTGKHESGYWTTLGTGLGEVLRNHRVRTVCLGLFLTVLFGSLATAALVFFATDDLHGSNSLYAALMGFFGIGMAVGPMVFLTRRGQQANPLRTWRRGQLMFGTGTVATALSPWAASALPAQLIAGAGNGVENVAIDLLVQAAAPTRLLGTISSVTIAVPFAASTLAYAIAPVLLETEGARVTMAVAGLGVIAVGIAIALLLRKYGLASARTSDTSAATDTKEQA